MLRSNGPGRARCLLGGLLFFSLAAHAQTPPAEYPASTYESEYLKRLKSYQTVEPLGESPFGESIDLATGQVSFSQTDIVLEGTGPTIRVSRSRSPEIYDPSGVGPAQVLGDWSLDIPRISTIVPAVPESVDPGGGSPNDNWAMDNQGDVQRCTHFMDMRPGNGNIAVEEWWHGYDLVMDNGSSQPLLKRDPSYTVKPAGTTPYPIVTLGDVQVSCLATTKNYLEAPGEAFLAIAPDGTRYWFDWLVGKRGALVTKQSSDVGSFAGEGTSDPATQSESQSEPEPVPVPMSPPQGNPYLHQDRMQAAMYVTRIEDRFGNYVTYNYNVANPRQLDSIVASDGRKVSFTWNGLALVSATAQPDTPEDARTWRYEYANGKLSSVVLPDESRWTFALARTGAGTLPDMFASSCTRRYNANAPATDAEVSTITAPMGLVGTFTMRHRWHARSNAGSACLPIPGGGEYESIPPLFENLSLVQRTLSGPGLSTQTWGYNYSPAEASTVQDSCYAQQTCADSSWVDVTEPDGARTRYTHSTRDGLMEGKVIRTETFDTSGALLRTENNSYPSLSSLPILTHLGEALGHTRSNTTRMEHRYFMSARVITQQAREFHWYIHPSCGPQGNQLCVDAFGRPTKTVKLSQPAP